MFITQIESVKLKGSSYDKLSYSTVRRVEAWLIQWTCRNNFKAVVTKTAEEGIADCRHILQEDLVPGWLAHLGVKPEHFLFQVAVVPIDKQGRFWISSLNTENWKEYPV